MHVNNPLNQECPRGILHFGRNLNRLKVISLHTVFLLCLTHIHIDVISEFRHHLWVTQIQLVGKDQLLAQLFPEVNQTLLVDRGDRNLVLLLLVLSDGLLA